MNDLKELLLAVMERHGFQYPAQALEFLLSQALAVPVSEAEREHRFTIESQAWADAYIARGVEYAEENGYIINLDTVRESLSNCRLSV